MTFVFFCYYEISVKWGPLIINDCSFVDDKSSELLLTFSRPLRGDEGVGAATRAVARLCYIFKFNEDVRPTLVGLGALELMDEAWRASGLKLPSIAFSCVATSPTSGFVEIAAPSVSLAKLSDGFGLRGAFKANTMRHWLEVEAKARGAVMHDVIDVYLQSLVAVSVASYVARKNYILNVVLFNIFCYFLFCFVCSFDFCCFGFCFVLDVFGFWFSICLFIVCCCAGMCCVLARVTVK